MHDTTTPVAVVFPGQGSQVPGMASPWRDHPAFELWAQADDLLRRGISRLGTDATADELREPVSCQTALFVHHAVLLRAWMQAGGVAAVTAGHSLGEYNALLAAGALDFTDALRLVDARARATQEAADERPGTMAACLGFEEEIVMHACATAGAYVANDNAPGQVVIAGSREALDKATEILSASRGKVVGLEVGAAYHSPHMEPAVEPFGKVLDDAAFADAAIPVVANVDAQAHTGASDWPSLLRRQLTAPVRWRRSVEMLRQLGAVRVVELAATPVLSGMVKRIDPTLERSPVTMPEELP